MSEPKQPKRSTFKLIELNSTPLPSGASTSQVAPPPKSQSYKSHAKQGNRSPMAKPPSTSEGSVGENHLKNCHWVLEDEKLMDCGDLPSSPTSPTPKSMFQKKKQRFQNLNVPNLINF